MRFLKSGQVVDRFKIVKFLGRGGMGEVYLAIDVNDYTQVALKVIRSDSEDFEEARKRFEREAELYGRICHPNVVNLIATGSWNDMLFVALEYIIGLSLRQKLNREGPIPAPRAFLWMEEMVFGLHAAHQQGIIHRDIKPENIMITRDGRIKLIDFGLAREEDGLGGLGGGRGMEKLIERGRPRDGRLTRESGIVGTLSYCSPEQLAGRKLDGRSDIYSLGLVFYEMLTRQLMIPDVSGFDAILRKHREIDELDSFLPEPVDDFQREMERMILKMLKYDPADRYASTTQLVEEMDAIHRRFEAELPLDREGRHNRRKKLAKQEIVDTYYWNAMTRFGEKKPVAAVEELSKAIAFTDALTDAQKETLLRELDVLFYALEGYRLERELFIRMLTSMMLLYYRLDGPDGRRLKLSLCMSLLRERMSQDEWGKLLADCSMHYIGEPAVMREYVAFLRGFNPVIARDVSIKFIRELILKGELREARGFFEYHSSLFSGEGDAEEASIEEEISPLEEKERREEEAVIALLDDLERVDVPVERSMAICADFLEKYPDSVVVMERLVELLESNHMALEVGKWRRRLGVRYFWRDRWVESRANFIAALRHVERDRISLAYLYEMMRRNGEAPPYIEHGFKAYVQAVYSHYGLVDLMARELEHSLSGTPSDEKVLLAIIGLYEEHGEEADSWPYRFRLGDLYVSQGRYDEARSVYEEAVRIAADRNAALERFRKLPALRKMYSLSELSRVMTTLAEQTRESRGSTLQMLRRKAMDDE